MTTPAEAAKHTIEISKKHILDQQFRIARHRELISKLEQDGHPKVLADARGMLVEMEQMLGQMEDDRVAAEERLAQATVDEPSLAKVERDCPM